MARNRTLSAALVAALGGLALAIPTGGPAVAAAHVSPVPTGSSTVVDLGGSGWNVLSSATATRSGADISTTGFSTDGWLSVRNDGAGAPGTEVNALLQNGACPDVFFSDNMKKCFGQMTEVGPDTIPQFAVPWWYRTTFAAPPAGETAKLVLNGVVGKADVWVNGSEVATSATVTGAYARRVVDITPDLVKKTNTVAIEMYPNDPSTMLAVSNVDWTQIPPDNNTGLQFPVQLETSAALAVGNAHVDQDTAADLSNSALTVKTDVTNSTAAPQSGLVTVSVIAPDGSRRTEKETVTVAPGVTQTVVFPAITIAKPKIWWPYQLGGQPMYTLTTSVGQGRDVLGATRETFGIRTVTSYLTGASTLAPSGVRAFKINNVPIVIRGGGYGPDLFLRYSPAATAKQIALLKSMGLNTIRLEGHFFPDDFYQQMDAAGILVNAGFQCCDHWEDRTLSAADKATYQLSAQTLGQTLRNHPSVFSFQWSDEAPRATQETLALNGFAAADYAGPFISSAEYRTSPQLGPAGEKEGPYDWVPPNYWYDTSHSGGGDQTNSGGSWGFDSEQSAGNTVPTLDSIQRFMSPADQAALWQDPGANQYHNNYEGTDHGGYAFGTLFNLDQSITKRYGPWTSLDQYVQEAQVANYENVRAQFEAFVAHSTNASAPSTGTIYWQANKGWPTLLWSLYNNDGDQAGAYFGAQTANRPLHALYALDTGDVTVDNFGGGVQSGLTVESKVYDTSGAVLDDRTSGALDLASQQVRTAVLKPAVPTTAGQVYFVELLLRQHGKIVDRNVYWLPTTPDVIDWDNTIGNPQATLTSYANLTALQNLPAATVRADAHTVRAVGPGGADRRTTVTITNKSKARTVAFFLRADIRRGTFTGRELPGDNELQSSLWNGNDITLWPGESQTISVTWHSSDLKGAAPVVSVSGWNVPKADLPAN
jgi:exo-1,4-beta-D-glucosaminidase